MTTRWEYVRKPSNPEKNYKKKKKPARRLKPFASKRNSQRSGRFRFSEPANTELNRSSSGDVSELEMGEGAIPNEEKTEAVKREQKFKKKEKKKGTGTFFIRVKNKL